MTNDTTSSPPADSLSRAAAANASPTPTGDRPGRKPVLPLWLLPLLMLLALACAGLGYLVWLDYHRSVLTDQQTRELSERLDVQDQLLLQWQQRRQAEQEELAVREQAWQQTFNALEQRLQQQGQTLQGLTTTSRSDWQLAEAEFLLRLAQQRMLLEQSRTGVVELLQAADSILQEQDNADLFPVRDRLQRDITALKLVPEVDTTGLYLRLAALLEQMQALPLVPRRLGESETVRTQIADQAAPVDAGFWARLSHSFRAALVRLGDQVRIRHHDQPIEPLLPPDGAQYLRQNLTFYLEQAQLAVLRGQTEVYQSSLQGALELLERYYGGQAAGRALAAELRQMQQLAITAVLPSINGSLNALRDYLQRLHKLDSRVGQPLQVPDVTDPPALSDGEQ